jgi:hypothetical protein
MLLRVAEDDGVGLELAGDLGGGDFVVALPEVEIDGGAGYGEIAVVDRQRGSGGLVLLRECGWKGDREENEEDCTCFQTTPPPCNVLDTAGYRFVCGLAVHLIPRLRSETWAPGLGAKRDCLDGQSLAGY